MFKRNINSIVSGLKVNYIPLHAVIPSNALKHPHSLCTLLPWIPPFPKPLAPSTATSHPLFVFLEGAHFPSFCVFSLRIPNYFTALIEAVSTVAVRTDFLRVTDFDFHVKL